MSAWSPGLWEGKREGAAAVTAAEDGDGLDDAAGTRGEGRVYPIKTDTVEIVQIC